MYIEKIINIGISWYLLPKPKPKLNPGLNIPESILPTILLYNWISSPKLKASLLDNFSYALIVSPLLYENQINMFDK